MSIWYKSQIRSSFHHWQHTCVDLVLIHKQRSLLAIHRRHVRPQLLRTLSTAVADVQGNDVTRARVFRQHDRMLPVDDAAPPSSPGTSNAAAAVSLAMWATRSASDRGCTT
jgi:hypothetical protein